jgi:hypothetical protein
LRGQGTTLHLVGKTFNEILAEKLSYEEVREGKEEEAVKKWIF